MRGAAGTVLRGAGAVAIAAVGLVHTRAWAFICDDAYISFRFARNLAEHGTLAFNVVAPRELIEGYTNVLWVLLLALGDAAGVAPEVLAPVLTQAAVLAALAMACWLSRGLRGGWPLVPALLLACSPEFMVWGQGGLETALGAALCLAAMGAAASGRWRTAGLVTALAGLTRPDALLPIGLFFGTWLIVHGRRDWPGWRRLLVAGLLAAGPLLLHLLWRRSYYGSWVPNTWVIKQFGGLLRETYGVWYVESWARAVGLVWLLPLLPWLRWRHVVLVVPIAGTVAWAWAIGGDFMAYSRFLIVATGLLAVLFAWLLGDAVAWLQGRVAWARRVPVVGVVAGLLAGALAWQARARQVVDQEQPSGWLEGRWEGVAAMDRFARERVHVGAWMRAHLPASTWLSVGAAGALPYASGLPVVDVYGLVDPWPQRVPSLRPATRGRPGHQLMAPLAELRVRDPDLLCHVGHVGPRVPPQASAASRGFGPGYRWACVAPGAVEDVREPGGVLDLGYYCCLRPSGRVVGPFRDAAGPTGEVPR
jgi:arabinofuranosyltransferase